MSGSVFCESCGGTFFYETTVEENEAYVAALSEYLKKKKEREVLEPTADAIQMEKERRRLSAVLHDSSLSLYGTHGSRNPMPALRKLTAKLRKHRFLWDQDTAESHQMRVEHASSGARFLHHEPANRAVGSRRPV